jgi:hypothetical protein
MTSVLGLGLKVYDLPQSKPRWWAVEKAPLERPSRMKRKLCVALVKMVCEHAASLGAEQHRLLMQ